MVNKIKKNKSKKDGAGNLLKFKMEFFFSSIALVISIIGLYFAYQSNNTSNKAYELSNQVYEESSIPVWLGEISNEEEEIKLYSKNPEITMQKSDIYFPKDIDDSKWQVSAPTCTLPLTMLKYEITEIVKKNTKRVKGSAVINDEWYIPVIIDSNYIVRGRSSRNIALYYISYQFVLSDNEFIDPNITFKNIYFIKHLDSDNFNIVNVEWEKILSEK